jgi:hypothetical protein
MIMQIFENDYIFWFFVLPFFPEKAQNKKTKSGSKTTFLLMMTMQEAKCPTQVHFRLGRNERIFLKSSKQ